MPCHHCGKARRAVVQVVKAVANGDADGVAEAVKEAVEEAKLALDKKNTK